MRKSFDRRVLPERVLGFAMLLPLSSEELHRFRDELAERLRRAAVP